MISRDAAETLDAERKVQQALQFPDRTLQHRDLRSRIARRFQFVADLILRVG